MPIFCVQEHFLLRNNLRKLSNYFKQSSVLAQPASKDFNVQNRGRPKGGLAIIVPKKLRKSIRIIKTNLWRIQPIIVEIGAEKLLVINCYFPTDKRTNDAICPELDECLASISSIIHSANFTQLHIVGDLNYEVARNTSHVTTIDTFLAGNNLNTIWNFHPVDYTYLFEGENGLVRRSTIDHFVGLQRANMNILEAGAIHRVENQSDHEVIYCIVRLNERVTIEENFKSGEAASKLNWKEATADQN